MKKLLFIIFSILFISTAIFADTNIVTTPPVTTPDPLDIMWVISTPGTSPTDRYITFGDMTLYFASTLASTFKPLNDILYNNGTCSTSITIDVANGEWQKMTLTAGATCVPTFTQPATGVKLVHVKIVQAASGSYNGMLGKGATLWQNGVVPTITQTNGAVDWISCLLDGTDSYCNIGQDYR